MMKFYHICNPHLPVARKHGRGRWKIGRCHFFHVYNGFIGSCQTTLSMLPHKETFTGVPLDMALKMSSLNLDEVYALSTENLLIDNEEDFVQSVEDILRSCIPPVSWNFKL